MLLMPAVPAGRHSLLLPRVDRQPPSVEEFHSPDARKPSMPKHIIRRYLPDPEKIIQHKGLRFLGHRLADPNLWHLNRRSASGAMFWGLWCAMLPMPMQMLPAAAAAIFFRVNLPLCIVLVWVSNPLTLLPLIYVALFIGSRLLGVPMPSSTELHGMVSYLGERIEGLFNDDVVYTQVNLSQHVEPFMLGALVTGFLGGCIGYVLMRLYWRWHVVHAWQKRAEARRLTAP